jgi:choline dehydrogenase-like flavoprotein
MALKKRLADIPYSAIWDAIASCNRSLGRVRAKRGSLDPILEWTLHPADVPILARSLWVLAEIFFAAGARTIIPGVYGIAPELHSLREAEILRDRPRRATDFILGGNHVFCTTRMHGDPRLGVVNEMGRCHDLENLYIADTGIFPQCPSVNPMWTGMALAHRSAHHIAQQI